MIVAAGSASRWRCIDAPKRARNGLVRIGLLCCGLMTSGSIGAAPAAAPTQDLAAGIEQCRQQLRPLDDVGFARIAARCPELAAQFRSSSLAPWLPGGWNEAHNDLSAGGLTELLRLQRQWQEHARDTLPAARPEALRSLVADLKLQQSEHNSLWKRLRSALRGLLERQDAPKRESGSFRDWLKRHGFGDDAWSNAQWVLLGLLGLLVLRVLWSELAALGWRRRRPAAQRAPANGGASVPTPSEIEAAPLPRQPGLWLALLADLLARQRLLRRAPALTASEVANQAPVNEASLREQWQLLAEVADPARFAAQPPSPSLLQRASAAGRALLAGLRAMDRA